LVIVPVVSILTKKSAYSSEHLAAIFGDKQTA
jgi:hypothetical protein